MRGHTLFELTVVLLLMAVLTSSLAPAARRYRDRAAVVAAREITVGLLSRARRTAMTGGSAEVALEAAPARARVLVGDSVVAQAMLETDLGVRMELGEGRERAIVSFNVMGLGLLASRTIIFRRGDAAATLVVSGLGRVRRP